MFDERTALGWFWKVDCLRLFAFGFIWPEDLFILSQGSGAILK